MKVFVDYLADGEWGAWVLEDSLVQDAEENPDVVLGTIDPDFVSSNQEFHQFIRDLFSKLNLHHEDYYPIVLSTASQVIRDLARKVDKNPNQVGKGFSQTVFEAWGQQLE